MAKVPHMNTIKHKSPPQGREKFRLSDVQLERPKYKDVLINCEYKCGRTNEVRVPAKTNRYNYAKFTCGPCTEIIKEQQRLEYEEQMEVRKQEKIFGKGKNFLTALEGL